MLLYLIFSFSILILSFSTCQKSKIFDHARKALLSDEQARLNGVQRALGGVFLSEAKVFMLQNELLSYVQ